MGLDLRLVKKCCTCGHEKEAYAGAYTYNVAGMWYRMFPNHDKFIPIEGLTGGESIILLSEGIKRMIDKPGELKELAPPNGWGTYDGLLGWLEELKASAENNPEYVWEAWR